MAKNSKAWKSVAKHASNEQAQQHTSVQLNMPGARNSAKVVAQHGKACLNDQAKGHRKFKLTMPAARIRAGTKAAPYMLRQPPVSPTHRAEAKYPSRMPPTMKPSFRLHDSGSHHIHAFAVHTKPQSCHKRAETNTLARHPYMGALL